MFADQTRAEIQAKLALPRTCSWKPRSKNYYCKHFDSTSDCLVDSQNGFVITKPGHYYLCHNVTINNSKAAIVILASNVTLDLRGFKLATTTSTVGILLDRHVKDVTIKNGTLENFSVYGINLVSNYSNITLKDLVFDKVGGVGGENGSVVISDVTSTPVQTKENIFITNCIIRNSQTRVPGALIDGLLFNDVNGIYITNLKITNCDLVGGVEIRRSIGSVEGVDISNNTLSSAVTTINNNNLNLKKIVITNNRFRQKSVDVAVGGIQIFFAGVMSIENCQVTNNDIDVDAFPTMEILLDNAQVSVDDCSFSLNTNTGRIVGIFAYYETIRLKVSNVEFNHNRGTSIATLRFSVPENTNGTATVSSAITVQKVNSTLNQASNDYSFLTSQPTVNPVEPLSVRLEECTSKSNKNALIVFDLSNFNKSLVRNCTAKEENTAFLNQGQNNVFERNLAQDCSVGFENKTNGVFVANQAFFCATPYLGVSNTLLYTDPAITATTNVFN